MDLTGVCRQRGFTLVEMMVVIVIMGILAAMAYPSMTSQIANMRIKSAKTTIASAIKDAQAQSSILRKPVWIVIEKDNDDKFSLVLTSDEPSSTTVDADKVISSNPLPKSIRLLDSGGNVISANNSLRVVPAGAFQSKQGSSYAPTTQVFYACDTIYNGNTSIGLKFQNRSVPVAQKATSESVVCNL